MLEQVRSFRVVESEPEASLHPRAIWQHWKKHVIWDPRTYYGLIECIGLVVVFFGFTFFKSFKLPGYHLASGLLMLFIIAPLHWYSTHRISSHFLTRTRSHITVLLALAVVLLVLQISILIMSPSINCDGWNDWDRPCPTDANAFFAILTWAAIILCLFTAYILFSQARARVHPLIAELPYAEEDENGDIRAADWASANVAEGIPDDAPEVEGQVRL